MSRTLTALFALFITVFGTIVVTPAAFAGEAPNATVDASETNVERPFPAVRDAGSTSAYQLEPRGTVAGRVVVGTLTGAVGYVGGAYLGLIGGTVAALIISPGVWFGENEGLLIASAATGTAAGAILGGTTMVVGTGHLFGVRDKNIGATALGFTLPTLAGAAALGLAHYTDIASLDLVSGAFLASAPVVGSLAFEHGSGSGHRRTSVAFRPDLDAPGGTLVLNHTF